LRTVFARNCQCIEVAPVDVRFGAANARKQHGYMAAENVGQSRTNSLVRDMHDFCIGGELEKLACQMRWIAEAGRCEGDGVGRLFSLLHQCVNRFNATFLTGDEYQRRTANVCDWR